jgi:hypothetical protein
MTQKSAGRRKRDEMAAKLKDQAVVSPYVELDEMYISQRNMFAQYRDMATLASHPEVVPYLKDFEHTNDLLRGLSADVKDLWERTTELNNRHKGKNAMPNAIDEDEHMNIVMMFQQYIAFMGVHQQTILPIMLELDEHVNYAAAKKSEIEAAAIAAGAASAQAQAAINTAAVTEVVNGGQTSRVDAQGSPVPHTAAITEVVRDGQTSRVDAQGMPVPHTAAPTMAGYEAAATIIH